MTRTTKQLKDQLRSAPKPLAVTDYKKALSTGSTLLNLACTGKTHAGFLPGLYYHLVGDSASGKTFLSLTCLAEASLNKHFTDHRFIFDNAENGALMDMKKYFGRTVAEKLEPPRGTRDNPVYSSTVEEFFYHLDDAFRDGRPFIYILDSTDALSTGAEGEKFKKQKSASRRGKEEAGSFGTSRAKEFSTNIRLMHNKLRDDGRSIVVLITQTRDRVGFGAQFDPKTHSGGNAFKFYAALQIWFSVKGHLKKTVRSKPRELGIISRVRVKKNRLTGRDRSVDVNIYHSTGIDDTGSLIDYLVSEGCWDGSGDSVKAPEFGHEGSKEKLVQLIEEGNREKELRALVGDLWTEIEDQCAVTRKPRYG